MDALAYFSADYQEARAKFRAAARAAGAHLTAYENPAAGPDGGTLATDTAWLGPRGATRVLLACSGTHGVEGFFGSSCQVGWLSARKGGKLPSDVAVLLVHAINPYGFAWVRRVNEDNIDINRNFIDHAAAPANPAYSEIADMLLPADWTPETIGELETRIEARKASAGAAAFRAAVIGGQHTHPDGLFYGGTEPCWSNQTLKQITDTELAAVRRLAVLDFHTGLGPYAYAELICRHPVGSTDLARARDWYGQAVTSPESGESDSPPIEGNLRMAFVDWLPQTEVTSIAVEMGTLPSDQVLLSLVADNWLHQRSDPASDQGREIKAQIREAFFPDKPDWNRPAYGRGTEIMGQALEGLARPS